MRHGNVGARRVLFYMAVILLATSVLTGGIEGVESLFFRMLSLTAVGTGILYIMIEMTTTQTNND